MARLTRRQWGLRLMLVPVLVLLVALPWLSWQTLQTVQALSDRAETQVLRSMGFTLARQLTAAQVRLPEVAGERNPIASVGFALQVDGFAEEWPEGALVFSQGSTRIRMAQHLSQMYGFIEVAGDQPIDWVFSFGSGLNLSIQSVGPSTARAQFRGRRLSIQRWDQGGSARLEFALPTAGLPLDSLVTWNGGPAFPVALHPTSILRLAQSLALDERQIRVLDPARRILAQTPAVPGRQLQAEVPVLVDGRLIARVQVLGPVPTAIQQLQAALSSLIGQITVIALLLSGGLMVWTTRLSRRIHRLRRELQAQLASPTALDSGIRFTDSGHPDEVGVLSREMQSLLTELARYQAFLTQIPRTLRHELANPMSTLQTSLELLSDETEPAEQERLKQAAARGIAKLNSTLIRITEAASLEEALRGETPSRINLTQLCRDYAQSLAYLRGDVEWSLELPDHPIWVQGAGRRIEQMIDKLIDNACDFTPPGGRIRLCLVDQLFSVDLAVINQGPPLKSPESIGRRDFFTASRQDQTGTHLGLGLYVVDQIAQALGGHLMAENQPDGVAIWIRGIPQQTDLH